MPAVITMLPQNISHQTCATELASGPAGSNVDKGNAKLQPAVHPTPANGRQRAHPDNCWRAELMERSPDPTAEDTESRVAVAGHPIHPMMVTFPIAFLIAVLGSDLAYVFAGDPFWARASLWLAGAGTLAGAAAGAAGAVELLVVRGIRRRAAAWSHFVAAVMPLSVGFANWMLRLDDAEAAVLPWGLYLSALGAAQVGLAGWLGGKLVFHHQIGIVGDDGD
jgi:uncharacterized membrane protein